MRVLITGGAGFIGSATAQMLTEVHGANVVVLDSLHPQIHGLEPESQSWTYRRTNACAEVMRGDITIREDLVKALRGVDAVLHLAAETGTGQSMYEIDRHVSVNAGGTGLLLDVLRKEPHRVRRLVVASSRSIYGEGRYWAEGIGYFYPTSRTAEDLRAGRFEIQHPAGSGEIRVVTTTEDSLIQPASVYAVTKQAQEQLTLVAAAAMGITAVALRFQNVYGPGQSLSNPYTGILSIFSTQILNDQGINVFEDGFESRDFVFIEDVARANCLALTGDDSVTGAINIGSGVGTTVLEVVSALMSAYGRDVPVEVTGQFRLGDIRHNIADIERAERLLGFTPETDFAAGSAAFAAWVLGQPASDPGGYQESLHELRRHNLLS
ncbi:UDP-glucose 4-epimerase [Mycolicibacterium rhodesiae JS60]|nr:UDP-glucose 4-epimerase [Mycolicibacterium rhodesiae JS60]